MEPTLQIYGLPRTGTNFLEYLIRENTNLVQYQTEEKLSQYVGRKTVEKHRRPDNTANFKILLIKKWENFLESYLRWDKTKSEKEILKMYKQASNDYYVFYLNNKDICSIIFYEDLLGNEEEYLRWIGEKFYIRVEDEIKIPEKRMGRNSGKTITNEKFIKPENIISSIDLDEIKKIDKIKWKNGEI